MKCGAARSCHYTPDQMYGLVADVERYPEFLPWCTSATILAEKCDDVTVKLGLSSSASRAPASRRETD